MQRSLALFQFAHTINPGSRYLLTLDHLELLHYINSDEYTTANNLYERYYAHKQTIRSRLRLLQDLKLITVLSKNNSGGNTHGNCYQTTKIGINTIKSWPFVISIPSLQLLLKKINIEDRESAINLQQLALLLQIADMKRLFKTAPANRIIELSNIQSKKSTTITRLKYLLRKNLIMSEQRAQTGFGSNVAYKCTHMGSSITARFSLKKL